MTTHVAFVTGVSRGLGEALAHVLLAKGFTVVGVGRSTSSALGGARYRFVTCDLSQIDRITEIIEPVFDELARSRPSAVTLINNAAVAWPVRLIGQLEMDEAQAALATNLGAPLALCNAFLRVFSDDAIARRIINVSSGAAQSALAGSAVYCMSKAGIEMLTKIIAAEQHSPRLRCITLRPGIFETDMQAYMRSLNPAEVPTVAMFRGFKENGLLKPPAEVASAIVTRLIEDDVEHGRTYSL